MRYTTGHDRTGHRYVHNSIKVLTITSYFHHTFITFSAYTIIVRRNRTTKILFHNFFLRTAPRQYAVLLNCQITNRDEFLTRPDFTFCLFSIFAGCPPSRLRPLSLNLRPLYRHNNACPCGFFFFYKAVSHSQKWSLP